MQRFFMLIALIAGVMSVSVSQTSAQQKLLTPFGALEAADSKAVQTQARDWLKNTRKADAATMQKFETLWQQQHRSVLDRLADSFALGDKQVAQLLADARDPLTPAPTEVPDLVSNSKQPKFVKNNLALAYSRALIQRRVYEQALGALSTINVEDVVDPASYLFHRAVCEHGMLQKDKANDSINRLLGDVLVSPERYKTVSILMLLDMQTWKNKDLGEIARKMDNIERRLDLARGGPKTQKLQKDVIRRLDEIIKKLENQAKNSSGKPCNCPGGGGKPGSQPGNNGGNTPRPDSTPGGPSGAGKVDEKKFRDLAKNWGQMSERQREEALQPILEGLDTQSRQLIQNYFRNIAKKSQE